MVGVGRQGVRKIGLMTKVHKLLKHDNFIKLLSNAGQGIDDYRFINCALLGMDNLTVKYGCSEDTWIQVDIETYATKGGISLNRAYKEILDYCNKYKHIDLYLTNEDGTTWCTSLIYDYIFRESTKEIHIRWNKNILPYISGVMEAGKFCYYDSNLDIVSSMRIYKCIELIWKKLYLLGLQGKILIKIPVIRESIGDIAIYPEYKELNRKVIKPSIEFLNDYYKYDLEYTGNRLAITITREK